MSASLARRLRALVLGGAMLGCSGTRPPDLGLQGGCLRPCPATPNCVSSEAGTAADQRVAPFPAPRGAADMVRLAAVVGAWPRTTVVTDDGTYLHAESTTLLMRFVDDVEFRFDPKESVIHVRSGSRLGKSDLDVNRKRVEGLRAQWAAQP